MKRLVFLFGLILLVFLADLSLAGIPKMINYQGMLTDNSGTPLTDTVNITFKIYNDPTAGTKKWEETQNNVSVINGLFNVILGSVNPIDTLSFSQDYWLDITVGAEHMPTRLKFTSVGYAYRALRSQRSDTASYAETVDHNPLDSRYVNEGQANSIDSGMIKDHSVVRADVVTNFKAPYSDTADYAKGGGSGDIDWTVNTTDGVLITGGAWGIARYGNVLFGNMDSTHVNLGVTCTTGTSGQNYMYCTVSGGVTNTASGNYATVGGGRENSATNPDATVSGGAYNSADGWQATVSGGWMNSATGSAATVGGGQYNMVLGTFAAVGGGMDNDASGFEATVAGGGYNNATGDSSTVGGGTYNRASGASATVSGGWKNTADTVYATVGGGRSNTASGYSATVGGGFINTASGSYATVGGGESNTATNYYATVGGGYQNNAIGGRATVGGGQGNDASGSYATIGGGSSNSAGGDRATIGGGFANITDGDFSAIPGGYRDTITTSADYSMAFGRNVYVNNSYRVIFFDAYYDGRLGINRDDRDGGIAYPIHVGTNTSNGNGARLTEGGVWTNGSSRTFKENFRPLNTQELLEKISNLSVEAWNFKNSDERHIGPVAEDFVSAFDVGTISEDGTRDNKYLASEDIAGVALAGVKELINENQKLTRIIKEQQRDIGLLKARIEVIERSGR